MGPLENAPQRTSLDRFSRFALLTLVSALSMHADTFLNLSVCSILYAKHKLYLRTVG